MRNRRTNIQIIAEILRLARTEVGKTRIMYSVNMSHAQLGKYISFLLRRGFLELLEGGGSVKYRTTGKGRELLKDIDKMAVVLGFEPDSDGAKPTKLERKVYVRGSS
ncbi:MAG: hypothetical protein DRI26_03160 [Chloroflexi bacterium]|nr:MAG: hypothetical protein DRI26_03160 [Chloroflexota bacterium]